MTRIEKRVSYVYTNPCFSGTVYQFNGATWFSADENGAAEYPWLMNNAIAWVEERVVYEPEPWMPADIDALIEGDKRNG